MITYLRTGMTNQIYMEVSWNGATPSHHPFIDLHFPLSADPCRQQGERARGGLTSNKGPKGKSGQARRREEARSGWARSGQASLVHSSTCRHWSGLFLSLSWRDLFELHDHLLQESLCRGPYHASKLLRIRRVPDASPLNTFYSSDPFPQYPAAPSPITPCQTPALPYHERWNSLLASTRFTIHQLLASRPYPTAGAKLPSNTLRFLCPAQQALLLQGVFEVRTHE